MAESLRTVGLYARVSTDDKGQRPEVQLEPLRQRARVQGWSIREYVDEGYSGGKARRPQLDRLMADVRSGELGAVLVWRFDRFARSTQHLLSALEEFRELGVDFVSHTEAVDTSTPAGRLLFTMVAAMAEFEREIVRERVKAGLAAARARGVRLGREREDVDLRPVRAMLATGHSLSATAEALGHSRRTLARRLAESANPEPSRAP